MGGLYIPKWLAEHEKKRKTVLQPKGTPGTYKIRSSPKEIGWQDKGMEFSCIPDAVNPWDPEVLKAIWTFDPGVVPLWVRWKFINYADASPAVKVFGRHAIGRYVESPRGDLPKFNCEMPTMPCQGVTFKRPNVIEMILMKGNITELPGDFIPWSKDLYTFLRQRYLEATPKEMMQIVKDKLAAEEAVKEKMQEEFEYRGKDLEKYVNRKMEEAGDVEMKRHFRAAGQPKEKTSVSIALDSTKVQGLPLSTEKPN